MGGFGSSANLVLGELPDGGGSQPPTPSVRGGLGGSSGRLSPRLDPLEPPQPEPPPPVLPPPAAADAPAAAA